MTQRIPTLHATDAKALAALAASRTERLYLPQGQGLLEPMEVAGYVASLSIEPQLFVGQRVGQIAPTMCSRMFATLDQLNGGRVTAVLDPAGQFERANEYAAIMRMLWAADQPLDHAGQFYRFNKARTVVPPLQKAAMPIFLAATADDAVQVDPEHFDGVIVPHNADAEKLQGRFKTVLISEPWKRAE